MPRFQIIIEAPHNATDAAGVRRLRGLLKRLGRSCGLRCVDLRPVPAEPVPNPDGDYSYQFAPRATAGATNSHEHSEAAAPCGRSGQA